MMSASDGAAVFGAGMLAFELAGAFVMGWLVHAAATIRKETSTRIFFMTGELLRTETLIKRLTCFYSKTATESRANVTAESRCGAADLRNADLSAGCPPSDPFLA